MKSILVKSKRRMEIEQGDDVASGMRRLMIRGEDLEVSDGYHTMEELYDHRITIYIALARATQKLTNGEGPDWQPVWRSKKHADGSSYEGWFVLGIGKDEGTQITYHIPERRWNETDFAETLDRGPAFDGHTPEDVLKRLKTL